MSVTVMSMVYAAHFHDIVFIHKGKKKATGEEYEKRITVLNSNIKAVCLALADHANDEGEGAYPSVDKLISKTELSEVTVIASLKAMKQEGIISYVGRSKWDTCNYTINKAKISEMATWERQKRAKPKTKATLVSKLKPLYPPTKAALDESSYNHPSTSEEEGAPLAQISKAYESEIGLITSMIADELREAAEVYPLQWVLDAIHEAVVQNKRGWKYCLAILERWKRQGNQEPAKPARAADKATPAPSIADRWLALKEKELANGDS